MNLSTLQGTFLIVRITQELVNDGWVFINDDSDVIVSAENKDTDEIVYFETPTELKNWIYEKAEDY